MVVACIAAWGTRFLISALTGLNLNDLNTRYGGMCFYSKYILIINGDQAFLVRIILMLLSFH